jgi:hypothetical protein
MMSRRRTLIFSPLEWQMAAAPVLAPVTQLLMSEIEQSFSLGRRGLFQQ